MAFLGKPVRRYSAAMLRHNNGLKNVNPVVHIRSFSEVKMTKKELKEEKLKQKAIDMQILQELGKYLWPNKDIENSSKVKARVLTALGLLVGGKLVNIQVPYLFKDIIQELGLLTANNPASTSLAGGLLTDVDPVVVSTVAVMPVASILGYGIARSTSSLFQELRNAVFTHVAHNTIRQVSRQVFTHLLSLDLQFHLNRNTGALSRVIDRGTRSINFTLNSLVFNVFPTAFEVSLVSGLLAYQFGPIYGCVAAATVGVYTAFTVAVSDWRTQIRKDMNRHETNASGTVMDSLLNYQTVKFFDNELHEVNKYDKSLTGFQKASVKTQQSLSFLNFGQNLIFSVGLSSMMYICTQSIMEGTAQVGDLVLVNGLLFQLSVPLFFIGSVYRELKQSTIDMDALFQLKNTRAQVTESANPVQYSYKNGSVRFENVSFVYPESPSRTILNNVNFNVPGGKTVAIVGASGSGKSTILSLLYRFYDAQTGNIYIDEQNTKDLSLKSFREKIASVPQDTVLFNDTIYYNINYGNLNASREDIERVTKLAKLDELIHRLPDGYDTIVGERGLKLSGGEKQRVAIARCLLKDAPIILLDEVVYIVMDCVCFILRDYSYICPVVM